MKIKMKKLAWVMITALTSLHAMAAEADRSFGLTGGWTWEEPKSVVAGNASKLVKLNDLKANAIQESADQATQVDANNIRLEAVREAAVSVGAQGGLAWILERKAEMIKSRIPQLDQSFDFSRLALSVPMNGNLPVTEPAPHKGNGEYVMVLPPIVLTGEDEDFTTEEQLDIADSTYKLIQKEKLVPVDKKTKLPAFPNWRDYLTFSFTEVKMPHPSLFPKTEEEKKIWDAWVEKGWATGVEQGESMFKLGWANLQRDFKGMLNARAAYAEGKLTRAQVAGVNLGVTGGGKEMRINHRVYKITDHSSLVSNPEKWAEVPSESEKD